MVNRLPIRIVETQEGPALEYAEDANLGHLFTVLDQLGFELHIQLVRKDGTSKHTAPAVVTKHKALPAAAARKAGGKKDSPKPSGAPILPDSRLGKVLACFQGAEERTVDELVAASGVPKEQIHQVLWDGRRRKVLTRMGFGLYSKA